MRYPLPEKIKAFGDVFTRAGFHLFIVGGCIRDYLIGIPNHDYDFATDARPDEVTSMFRKVLPTGIEHGTVTVRWFGESYEVTTFRNEGIYLDMRHPSSVSFVRSLDEDLKRRDFTINAFAVDCQDGTIIDRHEGMRDLKEHLVRAIGNPEERFQEDALRILRALRFSSKLDFAIEPGTLQAMERLRENLHHVSKERIHEELVKLIGSDHPARGLFEMDRTKIMDVILPELAKGREVMQNGMHHDTVLHHNIAACQVAANHHYPLYVRMAALFHDIGKSYTVAYNDVANTYYGHDTCGANLTRSILKRLKASNEEVEQVSHLVEHHMFHYTPDWSDAAVRRFINRIGKEHIDDLFRMRFCDEESMCGVADYRTVEDLDLRIKKVLQAEDALCLKDLAVGGKELMEAGLEKGPMLGKTLDYLLDCVIEDPAQNTKEKLLELALAYRGKQ